MPPLSRTEFASAVTAITSAFGDPTRREIYLFALSSDSGTTASEVAQQFGLHPNVARHHLDKLTAGGHLEVGTERSPGGAGRPSKRYRSTTDEASLDVSVRQDDVVVTLLGRALSELGTERAAAIAEEVGEEYGRTLATAMGERHHRSAKAALNAVADALSSHGFAARAESEGSSLRIVTDHCPFGDAAVQNPVLCAVDRGMVKGMLRALHGETKVDQVSVHSCGDDHCVTSVGA